MCKFISFQQQCQNCEAYSIKKKKQAIASYRKLANINVVAFHLFLNELCEKQNAELNLFMGR